MSDVAGPEGKSEQMSEADDSIASEPDILERAIAELDAADRGDLADRVRQERRAADDNTCTVLVVGEFKKGKSALINALLNARICAVDPIAATAVPTVVRHGEQLVVRIRRRGDPPGEPTVAIDLARLGEATDAKSDGAAVTVRSATVELPRALLRQGLVLIDTPGVNGGLMAAHAAATLRTLASGDAAIFVTDASQELTSPELDFFRLARRMCPTVVVAMTKVDFYPEWRRILELDKAHLEHAGVSPPILPLAAPLRHQAVRTGDTDLDLKSGYPQLAAYLRNEVVGRKEQLTRRKAAGVARQGLEQLESQVAMEYAALADPRRVASLRETLASAKSRADRLRDATADWRSVLADAFADLASDVDADLTRRLRSLRDEILEKIAQSDPAETWPELHVWLQQRANEETVEHFVTMRDKADAVVADVAERFETEIDTMGLFGNLSDGLQDHDVSRREPSFTASTRSERALMIMRGSAGGAVVSGMIGTLPTALSVMVPSAAAVVGVLTGPLAAIGAGLAAVFARSTFKSAKETELRVNRAEASKAARLFLEQVELATRKDSRDTQRRISQRLRNYLRSRSTELARTAQERLEATAQTVKTDHTSGRARLQQLEAELHRLRTLLAEVDAVLIPLPTGPEDEAAPQEVGR